MVLEEVRPRDKALFAQRRRVAPIPHKRSDTELGTIRPKTPSGLPSTNRTFANYTRLVVIYPNGEKKERPPDPLAPGNSLQWDVDIAKWVEMKEKGTYTVSFTVNGK
jgi:hypothetical protein